MPSDVKGRSRVIQWLMFQMGGIGPMMGQANVFFRYAPEKIPFAIDRYQRECRRLFEVLDKQLAGDSSTSPATTRSPTSPTGAGCTPIPWSGVEIDGLDNLKRWLDTIGARPAVERGRLVPQASAPPKAEDIVDSARKILV